jgi:undecaprenyl-diphosphatase
MDLKVLYFVNGFAGSFPFFDQVVMFISDNSLFKGSIFAIIFWLLWFNRENKKVYRPKILLGLFSTFVTMLIARILVNTLPFRLRPIHHEGFMGLNFVDGFDPGPARDMSSLPSDHAAMFFAMAAAIYFINKKYGIFALVYTLFIIALPRIYLGLHFPSDILAGGLLGIVTVSLIHYSSYFNSLSCKALDYKKLYPGTFYAGFFMISYQIADQFESARALIRFSISLLHL